ncbi:winged helix-turn-helix domain-containing protein [Planosporangium sp. 12N6]|uniref:winged helix-turn-helix domain-containing protein n=1 Tax=Planosporangium spinosum TaxID=3402278 RepID=UPI003CF95A07
MPEEPAYRRIEADLRRRIRDGEWPPGGRLPTYQELANEYGVSLQPVRQALTRLESAGVVVLRMGGRPLVADEEQRRGSSD